MTIEEIQNTAESFRSKHPQQLSAENLPIDLITFVELELGLDIIPFDGLYDRYSADAAVLSDFSGFYVDGETYERLESLPSWRENRLRFTLAHELGHYILHRDLFGAQSITDHESLRDWLNHHDGEKYQIEKEANEFAGSLLVPVDELKTSFERFAGALDTLRGPHGWKNDDQLRTKTCEQIAPRFGVNAKVIAVRLDRQHLWPSIY